MNKKSSDDKAIYLSTGILHLDDLLSPDRENKIHNRGGILIGKGCHRNDLETPIIIIEGETGTGKTSLALQIAHAAARNSNWLVFFYNLPLATTFFNQCKTPGLWDRTSSIRHRTSR